MSSRRAVTFVTVLLVLVAGAQVAIGAASGPDGANQLRAQRYANGTGVEVGIIDTVFYGILPLNQLGNRLVAQYDFRGTTAPATPIPLANPMDDHETLVADIIAGNDPVNMGIAPSASIVDAAIDDVTFDTRRAASAWLNANRGTRILNLSAGFGSNTNGSGTETMYWDWFMHSKDALLIAAAGNTSGWVTIPADSYNGIAVGAMNDATDAAWGGNGFQINDATGDTELRGKPDILAPGVNVTDGISFFGRPEIGTSFAAPQVVGTAALLTDYSTHHPMGDSLDHRGIKALILNSARKRFISTPEATSTTSLDAFTDANFDKNYLACTPTCTIANPNTASTTQSWTPAAWTYDGSKLTVTKPLDDEQGVGILDADRAIVNLAGGNFGPGSVKGIGWDQSTISPGDAPSLHTYSLHQTLAAGSFLTATLVWDRVINESDGDGVVEQSDTYSFGELANLDLRVLNVSNQVVAESISATDSLQHLHFPLPANGHPDDYKLQVSYAGGGVLSTAYALAWWADPAPLVPGDYNLDGVVNQLDYDVWRSNFGTSTATTPLISGDGNGDGVVDMADFIVWRDHVGQIWAGGSSVNLASVPEPSSSLLVSFTLLIAAFHRTRI